MTETQQSLTDQQLDEIQARIDAATPGPWGVYEYGGSTKLDIAADLEDTGCGYRARREIASLEDEPLDNDPTHREWTAEEDWTQVQADAAFIAHAPADVAALLAELRRQRTVLATLADRWEQLAVMHCAGHPEAARVDLSGLQREEAGKGHGYRRAAADVREALRTGRLPSDLMTEADETAAAASGGGR